MRQDYVVCFHLVSVFIMFFETHGKITPFVVILYLCLSSALRLIARLRSLFILCLCLSCYFDTRGNITQFVHLVSVFIVLFETRGKNT